MIKFEVGKSYALHLPAKCDGKATFITDIYTVTKRTPCYLTFSHISSDGTKMPHCRCKIFTSDMRGEFVHATAFFCLYADSYIDDDSQPDENATAEITNASDNDNAMASQPANAATVQSDTNDNAKSLLDADYFKGKSIDEIKRVFSAASLKQLKGFALCYTIPYFNRMNKSKLIDALASKISLILEERYGYMTAENVTGDNGYAQQDDIIIPVPKPRTIPQPVSVKFIPGTVYYGNDSGNHYPVKIIARTADAVTTDFIGAWIKEAKIQTIAGVEYAAFMTQYRNIEIWADKQEPSGKPQSEDTAQPEITAHAEIAQPEALYMDDSYSDAPGDNSCPDMDIPNDHNPLHIVQTWYGHSRSDAEMLRIDRNYEATHYKGYSIFAQFIPSVPVRFCLAKSESHALALAREYCNAFCVPCKCTDARVEKLCDYFPDWTDFLPRYMDDSLSARVFRDFHYDPLHFFRDKGIHERKNDNPHDNPGFTVVPSEHITHQEYTVYPDTIIDECPYVTVYACDKHEISPRRNPITEAKFKWVNHFLLAVFFLCKFILPLYVKRSVIPPVVVPLMKRKTHNPVCDTFAALVPYAHAADIRKSYRLSAVLQRLMSASHIPPLDFIIPSKIKHSYFSVGYKYPAWVNHKKQFLTVTERVIRDNGRLDVRVSDEENGSFGFTPWTDERGNEYTYFVRWNEFCYASQGIRVKRRSNSIKFKLGFTYPALRNDALSANATVIAFDDVYTTGKNGKFKLFRHDIIFKTDSDNKCLKHLQTWTHIDDGVEIAEYNVYPAFVISADCYALGSNAPQSSNVTPRAVFSVGCDYSLDVHERKYTIHITARTNDTVSFSCDMLKAKRQEDTRIFTTPVAVDPDTKSENLYFLGICRADEHKIAVQEVPAEINDITPETKAQPKSRKHEHAPASDIEHKLIETKDLHFSERRKALDHNAAVISSCMFSEAVISLLSSISLQAILLLGFHMRLFIAKPKGKKNVIAGLFAKRLIECRELHANVRSNPANINAKYSASVPEGVKFFETKHRQLGFIFTE